MSNKLSDTRLFTLGILAGLLLGFVLVSNERPASAHVSPIGTIWGQAPELIMGDLQWQLDANAPRINRTWSDFGSARDQWVNVPSSTLWITENTTQDTSLVVGAPGTCDPASAGEIVVGTFNHPQTGRLGLETTCVNGGNISRSVIRMDWRLWHNGSAYPPATQYDFRSVLTHEMGHSVGFTTHYSRTGALCTGASKQTMCEGLSPIENEKGKRWRRTVATHDIDVVEHHYD